MLASRCKYRQCRSQAARPGARQDVAAALEVDNAIVSRANKVPLAEHHRAKLREMLESAGVAGTESSSRVSVQRLPSSRSGRPISRPGSARTKIRASRP